MFGRRCGLGTNGSHERSAHPRQIPVVRGFRERKTKSPNRLSERFEVGFRRDGAVACRGSGAVVLGEPRGLSAARSCCNFCSLAMFVAMRSDGSEQTDNSADAMIAGAPRRPPRAWTEPGRASTQLIDCSPSAPVASLLAACRPLGRRGLRPQAGSARLHSTATARPGARLLQDACKPMHTDPSTIWVICYQRTTQEPFPSEMSSSRLLEATTTACLRRPDERAARATMP